MCVSSPGVRPGGARPGGGSPVAVTMGEPAGVGLELLARLWQANQWASKPASKKPPQSTPQTPSQDSLPPFVLFAPLRLVEQRLKRLKIPVKALEVSEPGMATDAFRQGLPVVNLQGKVEENCLGVASAKNSQAQLDSITASVRATETGDACGVVTLPMLKQTLPAGFLGQTELCAHLTGSKAGVMMLVTKALRVATVTTHIPIRKVPDALSQRLIYTKARVVLDSLKRDFGVSNPTLAVSTLNPHGEEDGRLATEEKEFIMPAIAQLGDEAFGPVPADTLFSGVEGKRRFDGALCMFHDQALIAAKAGSGFEEAVNVTIGLPLVRCSPAHGPALDIAVNTEKAQGQAQGKTQASYASLSQALVMTARIAQNRLKNPPASHLA